MQIGGCIYILEAASTLAAMSCTFDPHRRTGVAVGDSRCIQSDCVLPVGVHVGTFWEIVLPRPSVGRAVSLSTGQSSVSPSSVPHLLIRRMAKRKSRELNR